MNAIETFNLTKSYGEARGICEVSLTVGEGDFFGFIGPNGAGKSTLIRTLLGLISPTAGRAEVFGKDTVKDKMAVLARVGYLPAEATFYKGMCVGDMLKLSARLRGVSADAEARVLCERLSLDVTRRIDELSLGNRKKVGIVCALQHDPDLCILDEPTSGLDPLMQKEVYAILRERNEKGKTVFLSTHVLSEISRYCKNAAVIREGRILLCDSVKNLAYTGVKEVTLRGVKGDFSFAGAKDLCLEEGGAHFLYSGSVKELMAGLSHVEFEDINISDPDLDDVLMHYYEKGGEGV